MDKINIQYFVSDYGELIVGSFRDELCLCDWRYRKMRAEVDKRISSGLNAEYSEDSSPVTQLAIEQLKAYFNGKLTVFDLPLKMVGTEFQKAVWNELMEVSYGETESYLGLSRKLNNDKAIRAVASANGANAISIVVPCHRIIGANGELTGYAGGLPVKKKLLKLESKGDYSEQLKLF